MAVDTFNHQSETMLGASNRAAQFFDVKRYIDALFCANRPFRLGYPVNSATITEQRAASLLALLTRCPLWFSQLVVLRSLMFLCPWRTGRLVARAHGQAHGCTKCHSEIFCA